MKGEEKTRKEKTRKEKTRKENARKEMSSYLQHECPDCGGLLRPEESTDGTKEELRARIKFLEAELMKAVMMKPRCTEEAFAAHVAGRVSEAVAEERARWTSAWNAREAELAVESKVDPADKMEKNPNYARFLKMTRRGRRGCQKF
tara:strand:+ start:345 stop:782 length:438 start_codon:yes stop_codon:yes gene_type:complete